MLLYNIRYILENYNNKNILIGRPKEIKQTNLRVSLPMYFPENFSLIEIKQNFIKLAVKVRYKKQVVKFTHYNNKIFSSCTCNDEVQGICKHQIAALHLLSELDRHFFEHLPDKNKIEDLKNIFI